MFHFVQVEGRANGESDQYMLIIASDLTVSVTFWTLMQQERTNSTLIGTNMMQMSS